MNILPIEVLWGCVEGHQEEKGKKMHWWARQNFDVDLAAKAYLKVCRKTKQSFIYIQLKYKHWIVYCKDIKQLNIHPDVFHEEIFNTQITNYWNSHGHEGTGRSHNANQCQNESARRRTR